MSRQTTTRPNFLVCADAHAGFSPLVDALQSVETIGFLNAEDFDDVDGDIHSFPLKTHDPLFSDPDLEGDAMDLIAQRLSGEKDHIGWLPPNFFSMIHVQTTTINALPNARYLLCLRDPIETLVGRYIAWQGKKGAPANFNAAVAHAEQVLPAIGEWNNRGKWDQMIANLPTDVLFLPSASYGAAVRRVHEHISANQIAVIQYQDWQARPTEVWAQVCDFLEVDGADFDMTSDEIRQADPVAGSDIEVSTVMASHLETLYQPSKDILDKLLGD